MKESSYQKIETAGSEFSDDESHSHTYPTKTCRCSSSRTRRLLPWIWCSFCTIVAVLAVVPRNLFLHSTSPDSSRPQNFPTDFLNSPEIGFVEKWYYNAWDLNAYDHTLSYNESNFAIAGGKYAGSPTPEIDENWNKLLKGTLMELSQEEVEAVQKAAPWELERINGKVYMEVDVFHNLHCINLIRISMDPEYYSSYSDFSNFLDPVWKRTHVYHCIEQLRQAVQCHSDMTPVPLFTIDGKKGLFTHSTTHTCRDFEAVKRWRDERNQVREPFGFNYGDPVDDDNNQ